MKKEKTLKVLIKRVGEPCEVAEIENTLEKKQEIVGGLIEVIPFDEEGNVLLICNEEGKLLGMKPNVIFNAFDYIAGDFIVVGDDWENADFKSLTDEEISLYKDMIDKRAITK